MVSAVAVAAADSSAAKRVGVDSGAGSGPGSGESEMGLGGSAQLNLVARNPWKRLSNNLGTNWAAGLLGVKERKRGSCRKKNEKEKEKK